MVYLGPPARNFEHRAQGNLEPGLILNDLLKEILVRKLSGLLYGQGLVKTTWEKCPDILGNICERRLHYTHGPEVSTLKAGALAHCRYIPEHGSYRWQSTKPDEKTVVFSATRYVGELAMLADMFVFATACTTLLHAGIDELSGADLVLCVQALPGASNAMYEYAGTGLGRVSNPVDKAEMMDE